MGSPNLGHLFYREYYRGMAVEDWQRLVAEERPRLSDTATQHIERKNKALLNARISHYSETTNLFLTDLNFQTLELKTTYPGLLIGSGWDHSAGDVPGEFKIGFTFDYTTGLPIIPGSSIKGALRSAFPNNGNPRLNRNYKEERRDYISDCLKNLGCNDDDIGSLEKEIFEGIRKDGSRLRVGERDKFLDAVIVAAQDDDRAFLGDDYITPHNGPYADPIPIKFLKVLPDVTFRFQFDLKEEGVLSAENKLKLFQMIILDLGLGAKTAVGYGQFEEVDNASKIKAKKKQIEEQEQREEAKRQRALENMLPVDRLFAREKNVSLIINNLREQKESDSLTQMELQEAAQRIKAIMEREKRWENPKKKNIERVAFIKGILAEEVEPE